MWLLIHVSKRGPWLWYVFCSLVPFPLGHIIHYTIAPLPVRCTWLLSTHYVYDTTNTKWGLCCQKQVSQAEICNYIPQFTVECNYLSLPEIPAGNKVHKWSTTTPCGYSYIESNHSHSDVNVRYQRCRQATMMCTKNYIVCCNYDMWGLAIFLRYLICTWFNFKQASCKCTNIYAILMQWNAVSPAIESV